MDLIKEGYNVLLVWEGQTVQDIEGYVMDMKKIAQVSLENLERIEMGKFSLIREITLVLLI